MGERKPEPGLDRREHRDRRRAHDGGAHGNPTAVFQTVPFPEGLSPDIRVADYAEDPRARAIAEAARRLVELRDRWLNPPEWVEWLDEPVPQFPKRAVARDETAKKKLRKRTLTNLYNARPQWLEDAHAALGCGCRRSLRVGSAYRGGRSGARTFRTQCGAQRRRTINRRRYVP